MAAVATPPVPHNITPLRDPQALLERTRHEWRARSAQDDLWIFGYASLLWRPEFDAVEHRNAHVRGWHRAFRMASRINRGTPEQPGLVFALLPGGSCHGAVYRVRHSQANEVLEQLWFREMPTGVYDPRWLACNTSRGEVQALAFTLSRKSPQHTGAIDDERMLQILRSARGRYGTTLEYLLRTAQALRERGVKDREIERLVRLSRVHGLA
jgi:glutathione-specific gamma-glutamylcyclotransferase